MKSKLRAGIFAFIVTMLLGLLLFSGWKIGRILRSNAQASDLYENARASFSTEAEDNVLPQLDWPMLQQEYPDAVGWIFCPETPLDYPIVQGADNDFYLTHLADGSYSRHGAIFADYRIEALFADENTLLYGHNMKDGTMFHGLLNWGNADYAATHPIIYILTPDETYQVQIFSACVVDASSEIYQMSFAGEKAAWLSRCTQLSYFTADFAPDAASPIVTFSTCSGNERRFVVQGEGKRFCKGGGTGG